MTISIEEHVARARRRMATAANLAGQYSDKGPLAEIVLGMVDLDHAIVGLTSIRESERAACEAILREESEAARPDLHGRVDPCELAANRIAARKIIPAAGSHSPACPQDTGPKRP